MHSAALSFIILFISIMQLDINFVSSRQQEKNFCILENTNTLGMCKIVTQCPSAMRSLASGKLPQTCENIGALLIVCCAPSQQPVGWLSRQKCKEYSKIAYTTFISPGLSGQTPKNISTLECPFEVVPLILGGSRAKPKELPHSAAVGYDGPKGHRVYYCGGSLISSNYVLSAAHCKTHPVVGKAKYVRLGDLNLAISTDDAKPQEYDIADFILHPEYRPPARYNDVVLIRLADHVQFNHYVRPICLHTGPDVPTESAIASGWGHTKENKGSDDLLKVTLNFFPGNECRRYYKPHARTLRNGIRLSSQICAGSKVEIKDTCEGDSGGPLQIYHSEVKCSYLLVGITSFGPQCAKSRIPGIFTRVSSYINWIEKTVWS